MNFPDKVIENLIRIGNRAIISIPNFGFWRIRKGFLFNGQMPKNKILPYEWYNTPNIHLCSYNDFLKYCVSKNIFINQIISLNESGKITQNSFFRNLLSYQVIFCISREKSIDNDES